MRGEDAMSVWIDFARTGSPPHARGRPSQEPSWCLESGITPACAGKTLRDGQTFPAGPDHPRMRGEDTSPGRRISVSTGSPPHARGRHNIVFDFAMKDGITPACAGKTSAQIL